MLLASSDDRWAGDHWVPVTAESPVIPGNRIQPTTAEPSVYAVCLVVGSSPISRLRERLLSERVFALSEALGLVRDDNRLQPRLPVSSARLSKTNAADLLPQTYCPAPRSVVTKSTPSLAGPNTRA